MSLAFLLAVCYYVLVQKAPGGLVQTAYLVFRSLLRLRTSSDSMLCAYVAVPKAAVNHASGVFSRDFRLLFGLVREATQADCP